MSHPVQDGARKLNANTVHCMEIDRRQDQFRAAVRDKKDRADVRYEYTTWFQEAP
jgi:hypothetical protein